MGINDPYDAYCLDEAIAYFGNYVKSELEAVKGKTDQEIEGKRKLVIAKIFEGFVSEGEEPSYENRFRDPMLDLMDNKPE